MNKPIEFLFEENKATNPPMINASVKLGSNLFRFPEMPLWAMRQLTVAMAKQFFGAKTLYVNAIGDPSVGIHGINDEITVFCDSGDFGGEVTELNRFLCEEFSEWYGETGCVNLEPPSFFDFDPPEDEIIPPDTEAAGDRHYEALARATQTPDERVRDAANKYRVSPMLYSDEHSLLVALSNLEVLTIHQAASANVIDAVSPQVLIAFKDDDGTDMRLDIDLNGKCTFMKA